ADSRPTSRLAASRTTTSRCDAVEIPTERPLTQPETTTRPSMVNNCADLNLKAEEFCGVIRTCGAAPVAGPMVAQPDRPIRARKRESCFMGVSGSRSESDDGKNRALCRIRPPPVRHQFRSRSSTACSHASKARRQSRAATRPQFPKAGSQVPSARDAGIWSMA
ncbi:MAG: hypothetical protein QG602_1434, partial [Verrucomicrobiota bacterium]|nr:hypothetical protein [Verrucomicrobiota bacterium]